MVYIHVNKYSYLPEIQTFFFAYCVLVCLVWQVYIGFLLVVSHCALKLKRNRRYALLCFKIRGLLDKQLFYENQLHIP